MTIFEAIILGLVQGLTEFLPVSSSGHLALFKHLFGIDFAKYGLSFDVALHLATIIAVIIVLRKDIWELIKHPFQKLTLYLIIATIPAAIIGVLFNDHIEDMAETLWLVGLFFILTGVILAVSDALAKSAALKKRSIEKMTLKDALITGFAQMVGTLPGVSRSGSTISGGLVSGLNREGAMKFSFLMSIPIILGSCFFNFLKMFSEDSPINQDFILPTLVGMVVAGVSGFLACKFMLDYIKKKGMKVFVYYMLAIGVVTVILGLFSF